jgi:hypothetical protein
MSLITELSDMQAKLAGMRDDEESLKAAIEAKTAEIDKAGRHAQYFARFEAIAKDIETGALNDTALMAQGIRGVISEGMTFLGL